MLGIGFGAHPFDFNARRALEARVRRTRLVFPVFVFLKQILQILLRRLADLSQEVFMTRRDGQHGQGIFGPVLFVELPEFIRRGPGRRVRDVGLVIPHQG